MLVPSPRRALLVLADPPEFGMCRRKWELAEPSRRPSAQGTLAVWKQRWTRAVRGAAHRIARFLPEVAACLRAAAAFGATHSEWIVARLDAARQATARVCNFRRPLRLETDVGDGAPPALAAPFAWSRKPAASFPR